jgi:hypothetical protein
LLSEQIKGLEFDSSSYDSQIDSIEKQIKAIQKQGDEQDRVNKLKEKELALEKAKEQLVRVYDATRGWGKNAAFYNKVIFVYNVYNIICLNHI